MLRNWIATLALSLAAVSAHAETAPAFDASLDSATKALCSKQVALIGESGFHGDGETVAFKVALVQRLANRCHFGAVLFEASHYDFLALDRARREHRPVSQELLAAAVGQLWNLDTAFAPLLRFLHARFEMGRLALGGIDDQLGVRGAVYSNDVLPTELARYASADMRRPCAQALRARIGRADPADAPDARTDLVACLADIRAGVNRSAAIDAVTRAELREMVDAIGRFVARDAIDGRYYAPARDRSMFATFRWIMSRLPKGTKVLVWAANEHVAKDARQSPSFADGGNFGSLVHAAYGARAYALGFSAAGGSFRWSSSEARQIPPAPPGSLEAVAITGTKAPSAFLEYRQLCRLGTRPGAVFGHRYVDAQWSAVFDGLVVFRTERPPRRQDDPVHPPEGAVP